MWPPTHLTLITHTPPPLPRPPPSPTHPPPQTNPRFVASANLHEGAVVANYPYDGFSDHSMKENGTRNPTPDDATFTHLAKVYARAHKTMAQSAVRGGGTLLLRGGREGGDAQAAHSQVPCALWFLGTHAFSHLTEVCSCSCSCSCRRSSETAS